MLTEVVPTRPDFGLLGAMRCGAHECFVVGVLGVYLMDTFLVPVKIILGSKTVLLRAVWLVAPEGFLMAQHVLPTDNEHFRATRGC